MQSARSIMHLYFLPLPCIYASLQASLAFSLCTGFKEATHTQEKCFAEGKSTTRWMQTDSTNSSNDLSSRSTRISAASGTLALVRSAITGV